MEKKVGFFARRKAAHDEFLRDVAQTVMAVKTRDPAARSTAEILLLYSGVHAIIAHRKAHQLLENGHPFLARLVSQTARHFTGIEIHPGAKIGKGLVIDHGMGVVIGETAEIGDNCTIYQGVTLGGTGKVGIPAKVVRRGGVKVKDDLDQIHIPDPVAQELRRLEERIAELEAAEDRQEDGNGSGTADRF